MKKRIEKFIVISPRAVSPAGVMPRIHPPLGAIAVLAEAKKEGYEVALLDAAGEGMKKRVIDRDYEPVALEELDGVPYWKTGLRPEEVISEVSKYNPDVIGISCCTVVDRGETARLAAALKKAFPKIPIILGGHEASQWYGEMLGNTPYPIETILEIDHIVVGPGQPVIVPLLRHIADPKAIDLPLGVASRSPGGGIVFSGKSVFSPSEFAVPDYGLLPSIDVAGRSKPIDLYSYLGNPHAGRISAILSDRNHVAYLPLLTSYGCGFGCSFCDTDKNLVRYSVDNVLKIIGQFESFYGLDYIDFMDNNFGGGNRLSRDVAFQVLSEVSRSRYRIGFSNGLTFESMKRDGFRLLRQFGSDGNVRHVAFPCENGNDRILRMIRKPHTLQMVRDVLGFARGALGETNREGFFIGGFPSTDGQREEQPSELDKTYRFIEECLDQQLLHQAIFLTLSPVTREYRLLWRRLYPTAPFEHCLFSRRTGIWSYPNELLDDMHRRVKLINAQLGRSVTRQM